MRHRTGAPASRPAGAAGDPTNREPAGRRARRSWPGTPARMAGWANLSPAPPCRGRAEREPVSERSPPAAEVEAAGSGAAAPRPTRLQPRARSLRAAASAIFVIRAARVSGRCATAIQPSSILRAEGGNAAKLAAAGGRPRGPPRGPPGPPAARRRPGSPTIHSPSPARWRRGRPEPSAPRGSTARRAPCWTQPRRYAACAVRSRACRARRPSGRRCCPPSRSTRPPRWPLRSPGRPGRSVAARSPARRRGQPHGSPPAMRAMWRDRRRGRAAHR